MTTSKPPYINYLQSVNTNNQYHTTWLSKNYTAIIQRNNSAIHHYLALAETPAFQLSTKVDKRPQKTRPSPTELSVQVCSVALQTRALSYPKTRRDMLQYSMQLVLKTGYLYLPITWLNMNRMGVAQRLNRHMIQYTWMPGWPSTGCAKNYNLISQSS